MKSIFATSSAIEASLLRDLLAQHEIHAEISGETIERGIGSAGVVILPDVEYREKYRYGSVSERRYLLDGFTRKISYFDTMGIRRDHIDADGDGKIETKVQFDEACDEESSVFAKASADKSRISRKRSAAAFTHPPSPRLRRTSNTSRPCLFS